MKLPKEDKIDLCLIQQFLVLQIYLPFSSPWSLEIVIADTSKTKRRINLVSALNKIEKKFFHVKVPNDIIKHGTWMNLSIDVNSFMEVWKGQTFRSIDSVIIGSHCKLRRIFTMRSPLFEYGEEENQLSQQYYCSQLLEDVPKNINFPPGIQYINQIINYQKIEENVDQRLIENSQNNNIESLIIINNKSIPQNKTGIKKLKIQNKQKGLLILILYNNKTFQNLKFLHKNNKVYKTKQFKAKLIPKKIIEVKKIKVKQNQKVPNNQKA
ncbi:hypothetical protein IMG5_063170 [Ichthyophthirius multifiliis]|uniref:CFA20 domain-containing protein n=1 Tax=Ichthyophthirius multifiliis TaxID=5932 RepID=G0QP16_ICHMU|nr:hypothetical protein IMG5_063170 [Ichthyophthirius multifiliis]EGR33031.1 hypothetical protein IMG5_063170 [Ichthyophthirius multifiliis]|eukprot:XP_004037017.1 hypothetical protein IMG5_063170 [Ichthyophthirius multifiliis]